MHPDSVGRPDGSDGFDHFLQEAVSILDTSAVLVGAVICFRLQKFVNQISICAVEFHAVEASNWYASPEEFAAVYETAGFEQIDARLIERPTPIDHGVDQWVTTFRKGWLDRAAVPEDERSEIATAVADRVGSNIADYVRLRFIMRKPN